MRGERILKVQYGNDLRLLRYRHGSWLGWEPDLSLDTLRSRIHSLFEIPSSERFLLTCTDRDNDVITIVNDDDVTALHIFDCSADAKPARLQVALASSSGSDRLSPSISPTPAADAYAASTSPSAVPLKQLLTKLSSDLESAKQKIKSYEASSGKGNSPAQVFELLENLSGITTVCSMLTSRFTFDYKVAQKNAAFSAA